MARVNRNIYNILDRKPFPLEIFLLKNDDSVELTCSVESVNPVKIWMETMQAGSHAWFPTRLPAAAWQTCCLASHLVGGWAAWLASRYLLGEKSQLCFKYIHFPEWGTIKIWNVLLDGYSSCYSNSHLPQFRSILHKRCEIINVSWYNYSCDSRENITYLCHS